MMIMNVTVVASDEVCLLLSVLLWKYCKFVESSVIIGEYAGFITYGLYDECNAVCYQK